MSLVSGLHRRDVTANPSADQRPVADDIENFVPNEFVGETQRFFAQDGLSAHDDRIFEAAALNQVFLHEGPNIFVINKRPCRRDLPFENSRRYFSRYRLRKAIVRSRL